MMKRHYLLTLILSLVMINGAMAQKSKQFMESNYFKQGYEILDSGGDQKEALNYFMKEIGVHPQNGYAHYYISGLYLNAEMYGDALTYANKSVEYLKKEKDWITYAYRQRADIYLKLGNEVAALNDFQLALKADPKDIETYYERAEYYFQKGDFEKSDADFERICQLDPSSTLGYMGKGRNALNCEKYQEAADLFSYSIKLDSSFSQAYTFRAGCFFHLNRTAEAVDDVITALGLDGNDMAFDLMMTSEDSVAQMFLTKLKVQKAKQPAEPMWPFYIGVFHETHKHYMEAIDCYTESMNISANDALYERIAFCYNELGYHELALENINRAIEADHDDASYVALKASLLYNIGRGQEAIEAYDEYIKMKPDFFAGYYQRGFLKDNLKDTDGAIEDYTTAIVLKPDYAYSYLGRGDKYLQKGDKEAALKDYQMVIALDTIFGEENCAQYAYLAIGDVEKAKSFEDKILANSGSAGNYYDAACLYARMGDKESSVKFLRKAFEKGFTRFAHIKLDDDLDVIRDMKEYKDLMKEYETKYHEKLIKMRSEERQKDYHLL